MARPRGKSGLLLETHHTQREKDRAFVASDRGGNATELKEERRSFKFGWREIRGGNTARDGLKHSAAACARYGLIHILVYCGVLGQLQWLPLMRTGLSLSRQPNFSSAKTHVHRIMLSALPRPWQFIQCALQLPIGSVRRPCSFDRDENVIWSFLAHQALWSFRNHTKNTKAIPPAYEKPLGKKNGGEESDYVTRG